MNELYIKLLISFILLLVSAFTNYLLLYKNFRQYSIISFFVIIGLYILFFLLDNFLYKYDILEYVATVLLFTFLISINFEDIKTKSIDIRIIVLYVIVFLLYRIAYLNLYTFLQGILGFVFVLIIMLIPYFLKKGSIGLGDIYAMAACGMIIGFPNIFHFLFKTFLFVFFAGLIIRITKKKKEFSEIPLAPFLLLATII